MKVKVELKNLFSEYGKFESKHKVRITLFWIALFTFFSISNILMYYPDNMKWYHYIPMVILALDVIELSVHLYRAKVKKKDELSKK